MSFLARDWPRGFIVGLLAIALAAAGGDSQAADGRFRLCLDPGHGGSDPGAVAGSLVEKELNLDIARRVRALLDPAEFDVTLTRDEDRALGNSARAEICNAAAAQAVLSIHLNASTDTSVDYAWFFYGKPQKDKAFTATMDTNYRILNASGSAPLPHKAITNFANGTLLKSRAPAALAEGLFMTNSQERVLLAATDDSSRRQQIATHLVAGILAFSGR